MNRAVHDPDDDRAERERIRWGAMPHHHLEGVAPPFLRAEPMEVWGRPVSFTIALAPPEFADRLYKKAPLCPACGKRTHPADRLAALLHSTYSNGSSLGFGVWVHAACFASCPEAGGPTPVPW